MNLAKLRDELRHDEGVRLSAYRDSMGYWTIGVGHLLGASPRMSSITESECDALLEADIETAIMLVAKLTPSLFQISQTEFLDVRLRAIVNMAFNLGPRLAEFEKFLAAVRSADWLTAASEMANSLWAKQVGPRAQRLEQMILTGEEPAA